MSSSLRTMLAAALVLASVAICRPAFGAEEKPEFAAKPTVTKDGDKTVIAFEVTKPTDVEVSILDAKGEVVRHLAAGLIGAGAQHAVPLQAGLVQKLTWDSKDDVKKAAAGGPFTVRVRLGLDVKLDGFFNEAKHHFAGFFGMATDSKGNVYICGPSTGNKGPDGTRYMQVFDRKGKYVRTIMPMPADLPLEKVKPFKAIITEDKHIAPRNYRGTWPVLYGGLRGGSMAPRIANDGIIWFTDGQNVAAVRTDGGGVDKSFSRRMWKTALHRTIRVWLMSWGSRIAVSPDGKTLYIAGLHQRKPFRKQPLVHPRGRVYRVNAASGYAETFAELKRPDGKPGSATAMTVDKDGNLLVCDAASNRVVMLSPAGKEVGSLAVPTPRVVYLHRKTGAVYVLSYKKSGTYRATKHVYKFDGFKKDAKELAKIKLTDEGYNAKMALDDSADPAVIWVGTDRSKTGDAHALRTRARVYRLEDRGGKFVETDHECKFRNVPMGVVTRLAVHPKTDVLVCRGEYTHAAAYKGLTGERIKAPFSRAVDMAVGKDGYIYVQINHSWAGPLCKYDENLKPVVISMGKKPPNAVLGRVFGRWGNGFGVAGIDADAKGRLYIAQQLDQQTVAGDCVTVHRPDGVAEDPGRMKDHPRFKKHGMWKSAIFGPIASVVGNIQVDWDGYMYLALRGLPFDHKAPAGFDKDTAYWAVVGSVMKIKPEGGSCFALGGPLTRPPRKERKVPEGMTGIRIIRRASHPRGPTFVENAVKAYPGIGSMSGSYGGGCRCRQPMFQLDKWGRLFIPNAVTYSVKIVDNAGNLIKTFGHYGNADSRGEKAYEEAVEADENTNLVKTPAIPLGWPEAVGVSDKAIYVADVLNRRVVRLLKTYAAEETAPIQ
jgi:hypothetical protein